MSFSVTQKLLYLLNYSNGKELFSQFGFCVSFGPYLSLVWKWDLDKVRCDLAFLFTRGIFNAALSSEIRPLSAKTELVDE